MSAVAPNMVSHADLPDPGSRFVNVDELTWEKSQFAGIEYKTLLVDEDTGMLTALLRMAPGARLPDHEHTLLEQTFVLEGTLADDDGEVTAGSRHSAHAPDGGLMIAFFLKPNRFLAEDGRVTDMLGRDFEATWGERKIS